MNETVVNNYYNTTVVNRNVNVNNNVRYVNQGVPGARHATSPLRVHLCQPVFREFSLPLTREVASAPVGFSAPSVAPTKQAVMGSGAATKRAPARCSRGPARCAKTTPPPPPPSFEKQQACHSSEIMDSPSRGTIAANSAGRTTATVAPSRSLRRPPRPHPRVNALQGQNNPNRPSNAAGAPNQSSGKPANTRAYNDRPPASRPATVENLNSNRSTSRNLSSSSEAGPGTPAARAAAVQAQQKLHSRMSDAANSRS